MSTKTCKSIGLERTRDLKNRHGWTLTEDKHLCNIVETHGAQNWNSIAKAMCEKFPLRVLTSKQCRERWHNSLEAGINHKKWTIPEQASLLLWHMKLGNQWYEISEKLKGRHNNMIKNRFYTTLRKIRGKIKTLDYRIKSSLEIVEVYYMISVMKNYVDKENPTINAKRRRGVDYMFSLIKDVTEKEIEKYETLFQKKFPLKTTLKEKLIEIIGLESSTELNFFTSGVPSKTQAKDTQSIECKITLKSILEFCSGGKTGIFILPEPDLEFSKNLKNEDILMRTDLN